MAKTVADGLWEMLVGAGIRRCYGIVGDALNPVVDAMRGNGSIDFVHVRNEEFGVFAAVAEAKLTGTPVAVCGTAGPGVAHLINGMLDALKERVPIIVLAGSTESGLLDSDTVEEFNLGPRIKPIRPEYLAATLSDLADEDALFFADTGTPIIWAARHIRYGPHRRLFGSFSWASMANASPSAFGAQLAFPGRQTIALCGDGGFTMLALGDLLTEVQRRARVVHIVLNNSGLDFIKIEQQEAGFVPLGTEFTNPNFAAVAEAMGARGIRIEDPADVVEGLRSALGDNTGPVIVDVLTDPYALAVPAHVPAATAKGFTLSVAKQVFSGRLDDVIETAEHNVRLV